MTTTFEEWTRERLNVAREEAAEYGTTIELAMLRAQWMYVSEILEKFPDINLPDALRELALLAAYEDVRPKS